MYLLLFISSDNVRRQSELKKTSHDLFKWNYKDNFCFMTKNMNKPDGRGHMLCSRLQFSERWRKLESLTKEREVWNEVKGQDEGFEVREEDVFKARLATLFHSRAPGHFK